MARARVFEICQYELNPRTGEDLGFSEEKILEGLSHRTIREYLYICHDRDVYSQAEEERHVRNLEQEYARMPQEKKTGTAQEYVKEHQYIFAGKTKPRHWHVYVNLGNSAKTPKEIAKWFHVPEQQVDIKRGRGAFLDCAEYATHEDEKQQNAGKYLYPDGEVRASFDFRKALTQRMEAKAKYGYDNLTAQDRMKLDVLLNGKTLFEAQKEDPLTFIGIYKKLKDCRLRYLETVQSVPPMRLNFYVEGPGGIGKGSLCNILAEVLARQIRPNAADESELIFSAGGPGVAFDGYDGQPVIVWDDRRAVDFIREFGGANEVFNLIDIHPQQYTKAARNVKYGHVIINNEINIINGVQPYRQFIDGLCGGFRDSAGFEHEAEEDKKEQAYRRFPIIIRINENDIEYLINKGVAAGTREYQKYIVYALARGSIASIMKELDGRARQKYLVDMAEPAQLYLQKTRQSISDKITDPDAVPEKFKSYGRTLYLDGKIELQPEEMEMMDHYYSGLQDCGVAKEKAEEEFRHYYGEKGAAFFRLRERMGDPPPKEDQES